MHWSSHMPPPDHATPTLILAWKSATPLSKLVMNTTISEGRGTDANSEPELTATPTAEAYGELQDAYDYYNQRLFDDQLPPCLITFQRHSKRTLGYFSHQRFRPLRDGRKAIDEIAMNPMYFDRTTVSDVLSTLVHEMVHLWQARFGTPSRSAYHNKQWGKKMESIGLMPSNTGKPGGRKTGQQMTHYPIACGRFENVTGTLIANGLGLSWADAVALLPVDGANPSKSGKRVTYRCPSCAANAWGKYGLKLICGHCAKVMHGDGRE
jgi:SprT-like family